MKLTQRDTEKRIFCLLVHFPEGHNEQSWAKHSWELPLSLPYGFRVLCYFPRSEAWGWVRSAAAGTYRILVLQGGWLVSSIIAQAYPLSYRFCLCFYVFLFPILQNHEIPVLCPLVLSVYLRSERGVGWWGAPITWRRNRQSKLHRDSLSAPYPVPEITNLTTEYRERASWLNTCFLCFLLTIQMV